MDKSIDEALDIVAGGFSGASDGGSEALWYAVNSLKALLAVSQIAQSKTAYSENASEEAVRRTSAAIARAVPAIAEAAEPFVPAADVYSGLSAASDLAHDFMFGPVDRDDAGAAMIADDRFDHAALLLAELDRVLCRRRIAERGNPLSRLVQFRSASAVERDGQSLH